MIQEVKNPELLKVRMTDEPRKTAPYYGSERILAEAEIDFVDYHNTKIKGCRVIPFETMLDERRQRRRLLYEDPF